ncbi:MAG: hypothetical protein V3V78_04160 [Candidatus Woesearchaeota archaeon]
MTKITCAHCGKETEERDSFHIDYNTLKQEPSAVFVENLCLHCYLLHNHCYAPLINQ